jgi:hypothetical protein
MLINNKMKQHAQGNWGSDKFTKEHTEVKVVEDVAEVKYIKPKKGKKTKKKNKPYVSMFHCCPHCHAELHQIAIRPEHIGRFSIFNQRETVCRKCGAIEIEQCPACKNSTWYSPRSQWYKHQAIGCGFEGKLLKKKENYHG